MRVGLKPVERKQRKRTIAGDKPEIRRQWAATANGVARAEEHGIHFMPLYRYRKPLDQGAAEFFRGIRLRFAPLVEEDLRAEGLTTWAVLKKLEVPHSAIDHRRSLR